jgi:hypothetical protein
MIPNLIKQMQQQEQQQLNTPSLQTQPQQQQQQQQQIQYNNNKLNEININNQKSQTNDKSQLQVLLIETIKKKNDLLNQLQEISKQVSVLFLHSLFSTFLPSFYFKY